MRYTRYEYKKSSKTKFLISVAVIVGISISGGLYASNVIFAGKEIHDINSSSDSDHSNEDELPKIIVLQCGYYSKQENAKEALTALAKYCDPFIVEDDGKYRVLAGIYNEGDGLKKMQEFKSNNIDVTKISLNIPDSSSENKKVIEIVNGFLTIINKLQDNEVKSIKTADFKTWTDKIIEDGSNNSKEVNDLGDYVKKLPDEIDKANSNTNIQELYNLIKN